MNEKHLPTTLPLNDLRVDDAFWTRYTTLAAGQMIPYQYQALNDAAPDAAPSHCIRNLRVAVGLEEGTFEGFVFQDSDLAKWLEAVAYSLSYRPDAALEACADELIELIALAQKDNGYLNTYFSILHPGQQYCNLKEGHELYTAGHFIEAAVAYYRVTGKRRFLDLMCACADHICRVFRQPEYAGAVPGHEEIELALVKLAEATGNDDYGRMALEFVDRRGQNPNYLSGEHLLPRFVDVWHDRNPYLPEYGQTHRPVREQTTAEGHAVRALYLYSAMADLAGRYDDNGLLEACKTLYRNIVDRRMYITGGVGSSGVLERFTTDFDLPNDTGYCESCASIALALFCRRMARITGEAAYMDTAELALMNTVLAGTALDGKSFFYVNPLEVVPAACLPATDKNHVKPVRQKWFGCACCPPNIARTLASLGEYLFFGDGEDLWVNMFAGGTYQVELGGKSVRMDIRTEMPCSGVTELRFRGDGPIRGTLRLRLPDYARAPGLELNGKLCPVSVEKGYLLLPLEGEESVVRYCFKMPAELVYADPRVWQDAGKCAVKKGPLVYCLEQQDNGENLAALLLDGSAPLEERFDPALLGGSMTVTARGFRLKRAGDTLYTAAPPTLEPCSLRFVPYCFWGNRVPGEMAVWVRYRQ